jgi:IS1 family transposase
VEFYSKKTRKLWIWIAIDRFAGKTRFNKIIDFLTRSRKDESLAVIVKKEKKINKELTKILTQKHEPLLHYYHTLKFFIYLIIYSEVLLIIKI